MTVRYSPPDMTKLPNISTVKRTKRANNLTPEQRQKLSETARQRFQNGDGLALAHTPEARAKAAATRRRNKKKTASDWVAEAAEQSAKEIVQVFKDAIDANQPMGTRLKAAQAWLDVEQDNRKLEIQQDVAEAQQHSRDELIAILADKLTAGPASDLLRRQLGEQAEIIDGEVVAEDVVAAEVVS